MGYGEVSGNQSVHWRVVHEDPATGAPTPIARCLKDGVPDRGKVRLGDEAQGHDAIPYEKIGTKKSRFGRPNPQYFRVQLRYKNRKVAMAARDAAQLVKMDGAFFLVLDVRAIHREDPAQDPPAEVRIDW